MAASGRENKMSSSNHDVNLILKARDEASAKLNRLSGTIKGLALGVAGYFSAAAIGGFLKSSVAAFAESEQAARGLSDALQSMGQSGNIEDLDAFAKQMQKLTVYEDDAILASMKLGVTIGGLSGRDLTAATTAAIGLSKAFNIDLDAAMKLVSKGATGNFAAFSKMGITFKEGMTDSQKYAEVLERGASGFRIAQGETETFNGVLAQLGNSWGDAKEKLGEYIAGNDTLRTFIQALQVGMENFGTVMQLVWTNAALNIVTFWEDFKHIFAVAIPTTVKYFVDNFSTLWTQGLINGMQMMVNFGQNIRDLFSALIGYLKGDGWNFEATGLTEGFQSTIAQFPDIAKREMTEVEKILNEEATGYAGILQQAMADKKNPIFDPGAAVAGGGMGIGAGEAVKAKAAIAQGWTLHETRTGGGTRAETPLERKTDTMIKYLAEIAAANRNKASRGRGDGETLLLTNFR
jgi:hypothetical protein